MQNFPVVQGLETSDNLDENIPNLLLLDVCLPLLVAANLLEHISIVRIFHHNAKRIVVFVYENLLVGDDIGVVDTCKDSNFIDSI